MYKMRKSAQGSSWLDRQAREKFCDMALQITLNGQTREFTELADHASLSTVVGALQLQGDRVAVEHNGEIVSRTEWDRATVRTGDRLEIVHFVGGGNC